MGLLDDETYGYGPAPGLSPDQLERALGRFAKPGLLDQAFSQGLGLLSHAGRNAVAANQAIRSGADATYRRMQGQELTPEESAAIQDSPIGGFGTDNIGSAGGIMGTFAGKSAKTADHLKLAEAKKMDVAGAHPAEIRGRTGWFKLPDGEWRFEIPDNNLKLTEDGFEHPELLDAYPEMKDIKIKPFDRQTTKGATGYSTPGEIGLAEGLPPDEARRILGHELQHGVQREEGFSGGTSPSNWDVQDIANAEFDRISADAKRIKAEYDRTLNDWLGGGVFGLLGPGKAQLERFRQQYPDLHAAHEQATDFLKKIRTPNGLFSVYSDLEFNAYQRVLGETEARAVMDRLDYTPEQRRMTPPLDTQVGPGKPAEDMSRIIVLPKSRELTPPLEEYP
jgi:hypothetical protein